MGRSMVGEQAAQLATAYQGLTTQVVGAAAYP